MNESKLVLKSGSSLNNVLQKGVDCLSAVFSLNGAVAVPSRGESAGQRHLIFYTIENVIRGVEILLMAGSWPENKTNWMDQSIAGN